MLSESKFHLLIAEWLTQNRYNHKHEVPMPEYGRADYIGTHLDDGHVLIIEGKVGSVANDGRSIIQLVDYCRQLPGSRGGYAVPAYLASDYIKNLCAIYHIQCILIDIPLEFLEQPEPIRQKKRIYARVKVREDIKSVARQLMEEQGTAGVSLRAIARELDVTAPAIYRYFPSLDDLILALVVDGFNDLADALEIADATQVRDDYFNRLMTVFLAYRNWALAHTTDFQLIYGNPIPGFHAPPEITVPAVQRGFVVVITILVEALQAGKAQPEAEYLNVPPNVERTFLDIIEKDGYPITPQMLYLGIICWTRIHGMIMLELFHHLGPTVGDTDAFYCAEVERMVKMMGVQRKM